MQRTRQDLGHRQTEGWPGGALDICCTSSPGNRGKCTTDAASGIPNSPLGGAAAGSLSAPSYGCSAAGISLGGLFPLAALAAAAHPADLATVAPDQRRRCLPNRYLGSTRSRADCSARTVKEQCARQRFPASAAPERENMESQSSLCRCGLEGPHGDWAVAESLIRSSRVHHRHEEGPVARRLRPGKWPRAARFQDQAVRRDRRSDSSRLNHRLELLGDTMSVIQSGCKRPGRCLIGHRFNPPHMIPLVEVVA